MRTELGDLLRKVRLDNRELLKDMAEKLHEKSSFLSAVENGKKKMPNKWFAELQELYDLDAATMDALEKAALLNNKQISINIENSSASSRELAVSFARKFNMLDEEMTQKIIRILKTQEE